MFISINIFAAGCEGGPHSLPFRNGGPVKRFPLGNKCDLDAWAVLARFSCQLTVEAGWMRLRFMDLVSDSAAGNGRLTAYRWG